MFLYKHFVDPSATGEEEDILRNLGFVLSTKRGSGYFLPSFGLSDVTFRTPEEAVTQLTQEIEENVRLYEPRVELVKVHEVYDDDGRKVRLVVALRRRDTKKPLQLVVDIEKGTFEFQASTP